jgi:hypothetical protein
VSVQFLVPSTCFACVSDNFRECEKFVEVVGVGCLERGASSGLCTFIGPYIKNGDKSSLHGGGGVHNQGRTGSP